MKVSLVAKARSKNQIRLVVKEECRGIPDFDGSHGNVEVRYEKGYTVIYCGVGEKKKCTPMVIRRAAARAIRKAIELKRSDVSVVCPTSSGPKKEWGIPCAEGVFLGAYSFARHRTEKPHEIKRIELVAPSGLSAPKLKRLQTVCDAVCYSRDLVNQNAAEVNPQRLAQEARTIARQGKLKLTVLTEKEIKAKGLGLLEAVGRGSPTPPRLVIMEYTGNARSKEKTAIIGKGITFDSGGLNLKTSGNIEDMRIDMAGAAAVLGTMKAVAALRPKINVVGVVASAHNAIDGKSYFPGDVYTSYAGKTVEITNTDAEGRLVLADAFAYCQKHYKPTRMIDLATLTGGVLVALGETVAAIISNNDKLSQQLFEIGEKTGERLWRLPLYEEHSESMKSDIADLRNTSKFKRGYASSITGGAFLQEFVDNIPWAHLDIAGTASNAGDARGEVPKYGTGFGVRLLVEFLAGS